MQYEEMVRVADQLEQVSRTLEGAWKIEIAESGPVMMMMSPLMRHEQLVWRISQQLEPQVAETHPDTVCWAGAFVEHPALGIRRQPDLMVFPRTEFDAEGDAALAERVELAVEVVSPSKAETDYHTKVDEYPRMGIPIYLLVDPRIGAVHVFDQIADGGYGRHAEHAFGDTVVVGPWTLRTGEFPRYARR